MNREELRQEARWRRCRGTSPADWEACLYFLEHYWYIRHPERGRILFELRDAQKETLEAWLTERYTITLKARQIGYSTLAAAMAFWETFFWPDKYEIFLSKGEREAAALLGKAKYGYRHMPDWMKARGPRNLQNTLSLLSFDNESSIVSLPSTQDPARGETAYRIVVDEWASLENPEDAWASIEPVADIGGRVNGLSTAKGSGNFFHRFWQQAQEPKNRFKPLFYPWSANSDRDETWYEDKAEDLAGTPWILHQEYPRNPDEAFIKSGRTVFDPDVIDAIEREFADRDPVRGDVWSASPESRYAEFHGSDKGELSVYQQPTPGDVYVVGADVAEGLEHGDYSTAHVIDVRSGEVCAVWHGHLAPDLFGEKLVQLGYWYGSALLGVEVNNHGLTTLTRIVQLSYPNIYFRTTLDDRTKKQTRKVGWRTQINTKPLIIDGVATALRNGTLICRDKPTLGELKLFVREPDGRSMHGSPFDDRVISLAIAEHMRLYAFYEEYRQSSNDFWSMDWWAREMEASQPSADFMIGAHSARR